MAKDRKVRVVPSSKGIEEGIVTGWIGGGILTPFLDGGDIVGDERYRDVHVFEEGKAVRWDVQEAAKDLSGHGGGDLRLAHDFIQAVGRRDPSLLTTNLAASMESHLMGFTAESSRLAGGQMMPVKMPAM